MRRFALQLSWTCALVSGCTVSYDPADDVPSDPPSPPPTGAPAAADPFAHSIEHLVAASYTLEELPTEVPGGRSTASRAICARRAVVGRTSVGSITTQRGIVLDPGGVTILGTLGGDSSVANAGNASGVIVGASSLATFMVHAFRYQDGVMKDLGTLGGRFSAAYAINSQGEIVGQSTLLDAPGDLPSHATLWEGCSAIDLGTLGGAESFARDINDAGDIVGTSSKADDPVRAHAVVWHNRQIEELDAGGALHSQAVAINEAGTIAGYAVYAAGAPYHALVWHNGVPTDLGGFGNSAFALGLNDLGEVVGMAWDAAGMRDHAVVFTDAGPIDLEQHVNAPGWLLLQAVDICDDGRIVGNGLHGGESRGFVLTPAP